jgi:hypothetical protein
VRSPTVSTDGRQLGITHGLNSSDKNHSRS